MCRSRRELSNEYLLAKIGVDTAENEPLEVLGKITQYYSIVSLVKLHCCLIYEILHVSRDVCAKHTLTTYRFSRSEGGAPGQRVPYQGACDVREDRGEPSVLRLPLRNLRIAIGGDRLEKIPKRQRS